MRRRKKWKRLLAAVFLIAVCAAGWMIKEGYDMYREAVAKVSIEEKFEEVRGKEHYTTLDQLPKLYLDAVIAVEDHRFYRHPGIDPIAILRAAFNDIRAGAYVEGGSTITQQLAKNLWFTQDKVITRKIAEVFMAFAFESRYSKEEILETYLNAIYFGNGYYCVEDAARGYFGKAPSDMTDYESTLLAGIPNAPSVYALTVSPNLAEQRQRQVLKKMIRWKYLTEEEAWEILEEKEKDEESGPL